MESKLYKVIIVNGDSTPLSFNIVGEDIIDIAKKFYQIQDIDYLYDESKDTINIQYMGPVY